MWRTNLQVGAVVLGTVGVYTYIANTIPQVQSDVPTELTFTGEVTAEQLVAAGDELYHGAGGCTACHGLGTRAPHLLADEAGTGMIGERCSTRVQGEDCKTYLHRSLIDPGAHVVEGYQPIMPDMSRTLSPAQVWSMVAYLQSLGGEVTVTGADIGEADVPAAGAGTAGPAATAPATASLEPVELLRANLCLTCHVLGGEGGAIGPALDGIGARLSADDIRRAILDPGAEVTSGYEAFAAVMPRTFGSQLTAAQLEALVTYLARQQ
ncbi:MAG TPA: c-type cytochrome [Longimicrobiales bacterium]